MGQKKRKVTVGATSVSPLWRWVPAGIIAFTALLFSRSLFNGFVSLDDETYVLENPLIRDFSVEGIKAIFSGFYFTMYHPLTILSYLIEYTLFELNPLPYHVTNVALHLLNTLLVFKLTEELSGKKVTVFVVCLLFGMHPMHVESVAWIAERKDLLYSFFYLFSLLIYLRYIKSGYKAALYAGALLFFVASLLSKPAAITLPVLLIAIDLYQGRKFSTKSVLEKLPFFALALLFGILAVSQVEQKTFDFISGSYSLVDRVLLVSYNLAFYLVKLIAPLNLSAIYYYPNPNLGGLPWIYYASLPFLILFAWAVWRYRLFRKELVFALAFFLITISVMLQIVPNSLAIVCDRYTYIPYIGLFYFVGQWIADVGIVRWRRGTIAGLSLFVAVFSVLTWQRIGVWKDGEILMTDVIKKSPGVFHCYWMRGNIRNKKGDLAGALKDYNKTIEYDPTYGPGYSDRGTLRMKLNDANGALEDLDKAISIDSNIPKQYNNRAALYDQMGNGPAAISDYNKAIELDPELTEAYINRGIVKAKAGDLPGALQDTNKSIELSPFTAESYSTRGNIRAMMGDYKNSIEDFKHSLKLKPDDTLAYNNLGIVYLYQKDTLSSCRTFAEGAGMGSKKAAALAKRYCR